MHDADMHTSSRARAHVLQAQIPRTPPWLLKPSRTWRQASPIFPLASPRRSPTTRCQAWSRVRPPTPAGHRILAISILAPHQMNKYRMARTDRMDRSPLAQDRRRRTIQISRKLQDAGRGGARRCQTMSGRGNERTTTYVPDHLLFSSVVDPFSRKRLSVGGGAISTTE